VQTLDATDIPGMLASSILRVDGSTIDGAAGDDHRHGARRPGFRTISTMPITSCCHPFHPTPLESNRG